MARAVKSKISKSVKQKVKKVQQKAISVSVKFVSGAAKKAEKASVKLKSLVASKVAQPVKKSASQRLIETFEKRKKAARAGIPLGKPPGRRGRRPKNVEYTPTNNEDEGFVAEPEYERLEHDTGIRMKDSADDKSFSMDRMEDFDEELNFDW